MQKTMTALAVAAFCATGTNAPAQSWPTKPVRVIVPFPPGGGADALARPLSERLRIKLGQTVLLVQYRCLF